MDNSTAQNTTIPYPDINQGMVPNVSQSSSTTSVVQPTTSPSDEKILQDLASQINGLNGDNNSNITPPAPSTQVQPMVDTNTQVQSVPQTQQPVIPEPEIPLPSPSTLNIPSMANEDLSNIQEANPINNLNPDGTLKDIVDNNLQDIIPDQKVPKALKEILRK